LWFSAAPPLFGSNAPESTAHKSPRTFPITMKSLLMILFAIAVLAVVAAASAHAFSGFPVNGYPRNMYGYHSTYYTGPWGERMVYGGYGYFPNWAAQNGYGYRTYGYIYTPHDLRYGRTGSTMGFVTW
jgi:hypothetical protein